MGKLLSILILFFLQGCSINSNLDKPIGLNCDLLEPPNNSGEIYTEHIFFKIFPRTNEISATYSGCQNLWVQSDGWELYTVSEIINGNVFRL